MIWPLVRSMRDTYRGMCVCVEAHTTALEIISVSNHHDVSTLLISFVITVNTEQK